MSADTHEINRGKMNGVRLLSFDGGDIRAVSQLIILDNFMRRVEEERNSSARILPCDYFHMMGGVGAGGIVVILLAVLRMEIEEAIEEFIEIWNLAFADASLDPAMRSAKLETTVKDLLKRRGVEESLRLAREVPNDSSCKAFVCATSESNLGTCEKFRNYNSKETSTNPTLVQAIRATCAIPSLFTPASVDSIGFQVSYVSGAYNFNNPASETIKEACQHYGRSQRVACMLSLGYGQRPTIRLAQNNEMTVMKLVNNFSSDCEHVDRDLGWRIGDSNLYYRFSVNRILDSDRESSSNPVGDIISCTTVFLEHHETAAKMNQCAKASERLGTLTLKDISGLNEPRSSSAHGLPLLSGNFVERPGLIQTMAQSLFQTGSSAQQRMVLSGLGGIGKTQITVSFLLKFLSRFRHILFIDGSSVQSIESGLVAKVKSLGATYSRSSAIEVLDVLANPDYEITRDWIIVYDNVDDPDINIGRYFPPSAFGTIIITSRNPNLGMLAPNAHLKLDVMSEAESVQLLLQSALDPSRTPTEVEREWAREIAKDLGYLPVALVQAGYFIKVHDCMHTYRKRLMKRRPDILGRAAKYQLDAHDGLYATLDITWLHLTPGAQRFMSILGFVNYTGFPLILLYRAAARDFLFEPFKLMDRPASFQQTLQILCDTFRPKEDWDKQDIDDLVAELEQYSLVTRMVTFKVTTLRLHPLVHSWTRDRLSREEKETYKAAAVRLLVCGTGDDDEDIYEFIYPHIPLMSGSLSTLHPNDQAGMATILHHQGEENPAITIWEGIQTRMRTICGRDDLRSGDADLQLACLYRTSETRVRSKSALLSEPAVVRAETEKRNKAAATLEAEVVEIRTRTLGADHPKTLEAIVQQAHNMPFFPAKSVEKILQGALELWKQLPGDNWEAILKIKEALVRHVHPTGIISGTGAIDLCTEILQARMERNGPDHHATLKAMENLAKQYHLWNGDLGNNSGPNIWISIVAARTSNRGMEHPDTLDAMEGLAGSYTFRDDKKCLEQWKEVVRLRQAVQGACHKDTLFAMSELARNYQWGLQNADAEAVWKEIIRLKKEAQDLNLEEMLKPMKVLATMHLPSRHRDAELQWEEAVRLLREAYGPSHKDTLAAMAEVARAYESRGRYAAARTQWKEIIRVAKEANGPSHDQTLTATVQLAKAYLLVLPRVKSSQVKLLRAKSLSSRSCVKSDFKSTSSCQRNGLGKRGGWIKHIMTRYIDNQYSIYCRVG